MKLNVKFIAICAVLVALSFLLTLISIPLPLFPPWLKLDFADIPAILGGFYCFAYALKAAPEKKKAALWTGIVAVVCIVVLKNVLNFLIKGPSYGGLGELANALMGLGFALPAVILYRPGCSVPRMCLGLGAGVALGTFLAILANIYLLIPATGISAESLAGIMNPIFSLVKYPAEADALWGYGLLAVLPFNIIKMGLQSLLLLLLGRKLLPILIKG